jgi:glycosyltransferase involved in cell wall biosynthesis
MGGNIEVLHNHVDANSFDKFYNRKKILNEFSLENDSFLIANTGLLQKRKNLDCLIRALAGVSNKKVLLLLIGKEEEEKSPKELAESTGVADQIIFTGWRTNARELI